MDTKETYQQLVLQAFHLVLIGVDTIQSQGIKTWGWVLLNGFWGRTWGLVEHWTNPPFRFNFQTSRFYSKTHRFALKRASFCPDSGE